jgi:hypothetical protein
MSIGDLRGACTLSFLSFLMGRKWAGSGGSSGRVQLHKETEEGCNNRAKGTFLLAKGETEKGYGPK